MLKIFELERIFYYFPGSSSRLSVALTTVYEHPEKVDDLRRAVEEGHKNRTRTFLICPANRNSN